MKYCSRCVLPETFPGIQFDDEGLCHYCRHAPSVEDLAGRKASLRAKFETLVRDTRSAPGYHCLMSWSGGKDSTFALGQLCRDYELRVLAFTFDNGFISPGAMDNMRRVADHLGVDHVILRPGFPLLRKLFLASSEPGMYTPKALERASGICSTCMGLAKGLGLRLALEKRIPIMAYGWSPGQIPLASAILRPHPRMLQSMAQAAAAPLNRVSGGQAAVFFPEEHHFQEGAQMPVNVSPLIFLDWQEEAAVEAIGAYGWQRPDDTDPNSTNCLLNAYANKIHVEQMGYHSYALELSGLVREGYMKRNEALKRLSEEVAPEIVAHVVERLGVKV
jgi:hypothetical protein